MVGIRILYLLGVFFILLVVRFFLFPSLSEYFSLRERLVQLESFRQEIIRQKDVNTGIEDEVRHMRTLVGQIEEFSVFDVPGVEEVTKIDDIRECSGDLCLVRERASVILHGDYISLLVFFKDMMNSKNFFVVRKLEVGRADGSLRMLMDVDYVSHKFRYERTEVDGIKDDAKDIEEIEEIKDIEGEKDIKGEEEGLVD